MSTLCMPPPALTDVYLDATGAGSRHSGGRGVSARAPCRRRDAWRCFPDTPPFLGIDASRPPERVLETLQDVFSSTPPQNKAEYIRTSPLEKVPWNLGESWGF